MEATIQALGVRKAFGTRTVLDGIDLEVPAGSIAAVLGPNGAGKTTLLNILSTLVAPDAGTVTVNGHDLARDPSAIRESISVTGQAAAVDEVLTGEENVTMMGRLNGLNRAEARRRSRELLESFDLADAARQRVVTFSGGMRRRLDLALSLVATPPVIFLDEPTTGLDTRSRRALWQTIHGLRTDGATILLTTQYLEEADELADDVTLIDGGRVVASGSPGELKAQVGETVVELKTHDGELLAAVPTDGTLPGLRAAINQLEERAAPGAAVSLRSPTLDDVFLHLTDPAAGQATTQKAFS
ncbi:daunorubicin resistance protein DrrA family ABC transporter ATP-binding protein [Arthrobacter castelli]|uniref:daunorubicin resistance protein DrrA family ABC transporter ATP-binding protein n=1 Tax=Arthrobacter castelli TaxID=271431 RepID=UPI0003F81DC0|nr:daunorubicin resistance protein DrrA family ABC transporter ATP-binding protein [Arthrobacter castelli]